MNSIVSINAKEYTLEKLHREISKHRKVLINFGLENGLLHPKTLELSMELDNLLNEYQQLIKK